MTLRESSTWVYLPYYQYTTYTMFWGCLLLGFSACLFHSPPLVGLGGAHRSEGTVSDPQAASSAVRPGRSLPVAHGAFT